MKRLSDLVDEMLTNLELATIIGSTLTFD